jgi:sua5/yciO/yrdC/ywlC family protein
MDTNHRTTAADSHLNDEVRKAANVINRGGIVLYPTDTVWGIGCDATNSEAVEKVFRLKQRPDHKAMIVLVSSADEAARYVRDFPEIAYDLIEFSEKPLTIVYDHGVLLAPQLLGPDGSVGIRVTNEAFSNALCRRLRRPLVSTSANLSGQPAAAVFSDISEEILDGVDYVVDYRRDDMRRSTPSTVMKLSSDGEFKVLRP